MSHFVRKYEWGRGQNEKCHGLKSNAAAKGTHPCHHCTSCHPVLAGDFLETSRREISAEHFVHAFRESYRPWSYIFFGLGESAVGVSENASSTELK